MTKRESISNELTYQEAEQAILQDRLPVDFDQWFLTDKGKSLPHFFVVCHGRLPKNFSDWAYRNFHGQTIAEVFVRMRSDPLPEDFTQWDLPVLEKKGESTVESTVAHCAVKEMRGLPSTFDAWDLPDASGKSVITLAQELKNSKVTAQYDSWSLSKVVGQYPSGNDEDVQPGIRRRSGH